MSLLCSFLLPNGVAGAEADPLGDGPVLLLLHTEEALDLERLLRRLCKAGGSESENVIIEVGTSFHTPHTRMTSKKRQHNSTLERDRVTSTLHNTPSSKSHATEARTMVNCKRVGLVLFAKGALSFFKKVTPVKTHFLFPILLFLCH
jgi:hypothetical protein